VQEKDNVIRILKETKAAVKEGNFLKVKQLSNQTIHTASISQDPDNIAVAVIVYSLGKIIERTNYQNYRGWKKFFNNFINYINKAESALQENKIQEFRNSLTCIRREIETLPGNFKKHIQDVFRKASINKASRIYEHGISLEQTANLLGITLWELSSYAGQTGIGDVNENLTTTERIRIKNVMEFFK